MLLGIWDSPTRSLGGCVIDELPLAELPTMGDDGRRRRRQRAMMLDDSDRSKDVEVWCLRHQLAVATPDRPAGLQPDDAILAFAACWAVTLVIFLVKPDTILGWHRRLAAPLDLPAPGWSAIDRHRDTRNDHPSRDEKQPGATAA
jgi:hypothetical protein